MEKAKEMLESNKQESETVSKLAVNPHIPNLEISFYEDFSLRGIRVDQVQPGLVVCSFKVPPRLTDRDEKLTPGAIANLVDEMGAVVIYRKGLPMNVSVTMSISYVSTAKVDDELEVTSRLLGRKGSVFGTSVLFKNKVTGDIIAEVSLKLDSMKKLACCYGGFCKRKLLSQDRNYKLTPGRLDPGVIAKPSC